MASVHDVAAYILKKQHPITAMKLQKLVYYSQAWSLAWDDAPLFAEHVEAWANGPVIPALFKEHRGAYSLSSWPKGKPEKLTPTQRETVDAILKHLGTKTSQWLSDLSHSEKPWKDARKGLAPNERGNRVITQEAMGAFYQSLGA